MNAAFANPLLAQDTLDATILIVDDDASIRSALSRILRRKGYEVFEAADGREALALASRHYPQLAIVDLGLPGISGLEVLASLREIFGASIHTAVLSGQNDMSDRMEAFDAGADDFIAKPVDVGELTKKLRAAQRTQVATRNALKARERAERLQLLNAEASSLLAHDINNGIAITLANLQYLIDTCPCDEDQLDALKSSERALRRVSMMTDNFVDVSRFEDGVLTPQRGDVDIAALLRTTAEAHDPQWASDDKLIGVECRSELIAEVDGVLLERMLHNLVGNALRYTGGGGSIDLKVLLPPVDRNNELVIAVSNSGPDIPQALLPVLFEKYRKGPDGKAMRGMGLYFCRMACQAHGGTISVTSANNQTTFVLRMPNALKPEVH